MKITKRQMGLFLVLFDQLSRKLVEDLEIYRECARQTLLEHDMKVFNLKDPKEVQDLAEMFFYHRIEGFREREVGEPAVEEVLKILHNEKK